MPGGIGRGRSAGRPSASSASSSSAQPAKPGGDSTIDQMSQFIDRMNVNGPGGGGRPGGNTAFGAANPDFKPQRNGFGGGHSEQNGDAGAFGAFGGGGGGSRDGPPSNGFGGASRGGGGPRDDYDNFNDNDGDGRPPPVEYVPHRITEDEVTAESERYCAVGGHYQDLVKCKVQVTPGDQCPDPDNFVHLAISDFSEAHFNPLLFKNIERALRDKASGQLSKPTAIQSRAIPIVMNDVDVMACAQTGSGKSAAFMLPIIDWIMNNKSPDAAPMAPYCIVLLPTRELSKQLFKTARIFSQGTQVTCCEVYGATQMRNQMDRLREGCDIVTCTAGRLKHLVENHTLRLHQCRFLVFDEADNLLDVGQGTPDTIDAICGHPDLPEEHQTLCFSATFPPVVQELAKERMRHKRVMITVGELGRANRDIEQVVLYLSDMQAKKQKLIEVLQDAKAESDKTGAPFKKTLVFCKTKKFCDIMAVFLSQQDFGVKATTIHGDREQYQREQALRDFDNYVCPVLISSDVCARGIDIPNVDHVINFDLPNDIRIYVHRIGRTARVGRSGKATSFYGDADREIAQQLADELSVAGQEVPDFLAGGGGGYNGYGGGGGGMASNAPNGFGAPVGYNPAPVDNPVPAGNPVPVPSATIPVDDDAEW